MHKRQLLNKINIFKELINKILHRDSPLHCKLIFSKFFFFSSFAKCDLNHCLLTMFWKRGFPQNSVSWKDNMKLLFLLQSFYEKCNRCPCVIATRSCVERVGFFQGNRFIIKSIISVVILYIAMLNGK